MSVLPPGKDYNDKFFVGFFENETLVAIMDLIVGYPEQDTCFIGLFMVGLEYQNKGIGSEMINQCVQYLRMSGFHKIRLGVDKNNPQSNAFWKKNGFSVVGEKDYVLMELVL